MNKAGILMVFFATAISLPVFSQSIKLYNVITRAELNPQSSAKIPNTVQFSINGLTPPAPDPQSTQLPRWEYFWDFGDCSFPSMESEPVHTYKAMDSTYHVAVTLTPIYSGEEEELPEYTITFSTTGPYNQAPPGDGANFEFKAGKSIGIVNVRDCKPGDLNTYIVPFKNTTSGPISTGSISFVYPSDLFQFDTLYLNECGFQPPCRHTIGEDEVRGELEFDLYELLPGEEGFITVTLQTKTNAEIGVPVELAVYLNDGVPVSSDTLHLQIVNSHDPNKKTVTKEKSCVADTLLHTVEFENEGTAAAQMVYVIDHIHPSLDMASFEMISTTHFTVPAVIDDTTAIDNTFNPYFVGAGNSLTIVRDTGGRKMAFVFRDIQLAPGEIGKFSYTLVPDSSLIPGTRLGSHADIFFDDNPPISTGPAIASIVQCYCTPTPCDSTPAWLDSVSLNEIQNRSGNNRGYGDYRHLTASLVAGSWSLLSLHPDTASDSMLLWWIVVIDLDRDGEFDDEEVLYSGQSSGATEVEVYIPGLTLPGETVMRIVMSTDSADSVFCDSICGEMEDYGIIIKQPGLPDLGIDYINTPAKTVLPGSGVYVTTSAINTGPSGAAANGLSYCYSPYPMNSLANTFQVHHVLPAMEPGDVFPDSALLLLPEAYTGTIYALAVSDPRHNITENLETNNETSVQVRAGTPMADLVLQNLYACRPVLSPGAYFTFSFKMANLGEAPALAGPAQNTIYFYWSYDNTPDPADDLFMTAYDASSLLPGEATEIMLSGMAPELPEGSYYLVGRIDHENQYEEYSESNNTVSIPLSLSKHEPALVPYYTGFECQGLDVCWSTSEPNSGAFVSPSGAHDGLYHLVLVPEENQPLAYTDLALSKTTSDPVYLSFWWRDPNPGVSSAADGIWFSNDGIVFTKLYSLDGAGSGWAFVSFSLDAMAEEQGWALESSFTLRFQHKITADPGGFSFDEIEVGHEPGCNGCKTSAFPVEVNHVQSLAVFPNPCRDQATIAYTLSEDVSDVAIGICNMSGQKVGEPLIHQHQKAGHHEVVFPPGNLPDGVYTCILRTDKNVQNIKLVISR